MVQTNYFVTNTCVLFSYREIGTEICICLQFVSSVANIFLPKVCYIFMWTYPCLYPKYFFETLYKLYKFLFLVDTKKVEQMFQKVNVYYRFEMFFSRISSPKYKSVYYTWMHVIYD